MIAAGFARYGHHRQAARLFEGLLATSRYIDLHRLPELFCGFPRERSHGPTCYPVACSPQAWAAAAAAVRTGLPRAGGGRRARRGLLPAGDARLPAPGPPAAALPQGRIDVVITRPTATSACDWSVARACGLVISM
jgi:hypothetical protein